MPNKVLNWIDQHFDLDVVEVMPFPAMPQGQVVRDKNGDEMVVFLDILRSRVRWI